MRARPETQPRPSVARPPTRRRGGVPIWVPFLLLCIGLLAVVQGLERDARARGVAQIDTTRYDLHSATRYLPPDWASNLQRLLLGTEDIAVDDQGAIDDLVNRVASLPFVEAVGEPEIVWPDGLSLPVRMYEPVACIQVGGRDFLPVAPDGRVLSGYSSYPHAAYGAWLPALGPHGYGEVASSRASEADRVAPYSPGQQLVEGALLDALDVARSMWFHLDASEVRELGPVVIDASRERAPTAVGLPGGVVIDLDSGRRILFGRPPVPFEPGELPLAQKWAHVREGLARLRNPETEWDVLDVRFDTVSAFTREAWEAEQLEFARGGRNEASK